MNFDPRGRLWVASSEIYPQIKPGEKANDKIVVLEDTKGVGRADKTTVFADGLLIPTGVEPGDGGAYVANSTELVHLSATRPRRQGRPQPRRAVRVRHRGHAPHHPHVPLGAGRVAVLQPVGLHPQPRRDAARGEAPERRRRLAVPARHQRPGRLRPRLLEPVGPRVRPLGPVAHHRWGQRRGRHPRHPRRVLPGVRRRHQAAPRPQPRQPQALRPRSRQRPAPAGRLAGERAHPRLPRPPRLPVRAVRRRLDVRQPGDAGAHQDEPPGLPPGGREDGAGRRDLHRRLVQPDHPARRGGFPRPAPRPRPRPHLARDRQGPAAGAAAQPPRREGGGPARLPQGPGGLDPAAGQARAEGARRQVRAAGPGEVDGGARPDPHDHRPRPARSPLGAAGLGCGRSEAARRGAPLRRPARPRRGGAGAVPLARAGAGRGGPADGPREGRPPARPPGGRPRAGGHERGDGRRGRDGGPRQADGPHPRLRPVADAAGARARLDAGVPGRHAHLRR